MSEAEKQRPGGKSGKETILTSFVLEQLGSRRANSVTGDSLLKLQADGLVIWLLLKLCARVCVKSASTPGAMIQTHVKTIFSDQSSLTVSVGGGLRVEARLRS